MKKTTMRVLIVSTISRFTLGLVRTAVAAGFQPIVLTDLRWDLDSLSRHIYHRAVIDHDRLTTGHPEAIAHINQLINRFNIGLVVAADTRCTRMLTRCKEQIQGAAVYLLPSPILFEQLHNKWQFDHLLTQHNLQSIVRVILQYQSSF